MTTEHSATCANRKMRPDGLLMRHYIIEVLLHVFAGYWSLQGRPEAQGFRKLATLQVASCKFCQEEEKTSGSLSSSKATVLRTEFMMDHHRDGQTNAARLGVICQGASSAPHFLLPRVQLSTCFPII